MPLPIRGSRGRVLVVLMLLSVTLITLDVRGNRVLDRARSISRERFAPVRSVGQTVFRPFENVWHGVRDYERLSRDYQALRDAETRNQGVSIEAETQIQETNAMRALFGLLPCSSIPRVTAEVVGRPATNYESSVEINRGSDNGVKEGNPVVGPAGLIGRIGKVSATHSFVQLLFDPNVHVAANVLGTANASKTPAELLAASAAAAGGITTTTSTIPTTTTTQADGAVVTDGKSVFQTTTTEPTTTTTLPPTTTTTILVANEFGDVRGNGRDKPITMDFTHGIENVRVNDPVATAGNDGSLFPACIPIGRVKSVATKRGSSQLEVVVEPSADLNRISIVTVILYDPSRRPQATKTTP
jgi:cell shape-determining protein MreC